mgnify:CR=1 FL=1
MPFRLSLDFRCYKNFNELKTLTITSRARILVDTALNLLKIIFYIYCTVYSIYSVLISTHV